MYEAFFSLEDSPFVLTPDPRFLFRSKSHHGILASLLYGITSQKGLMALFGDVGSGKTTLCRALLRELPKEIQSALVLNPHLSDAELVGAILDDLGVERQGSTKGELMTLLSNYLLAAGAGGKTVVVILDEAQQMSVEALEQIRILSNLETPTRKLLQMVLVGQPELEEKLQRRELRQLDQRIGIRCYLRPLSKQETFRYIEHRLRVAGLVGALPFTRGALSAIYQYSRGIPRVINLASDRGLTAGYTARARFITASMVRTAIRNLEGLRRRPLARSWRVALAAGLLGAVLAGGAGAVYWSGWPNGPIRFGGGPSVQAPTRSPELAVTIPASLSPREQAPRPDGARNLMAQLLKLWRVNEDLSDGVITAWPVAANGSPEVPAIAARYQLAATFLPETTLAELRAIALPALVELNDPLGRRLHLLRWIERDALVLLAPSGEEVRHTFESVEPLWTRAAWVLWRNMDQLPLDPMQEMTPTVLATVALRLHKLGHLTAPLPSRYEGRLQQAVRDFQRDVGLPDDGIVGPRTTLALSRVVGGKFNPTFAEVPSR